MTDDPMNPAPVVPVAMIGGPGTGDGRMPEGMKPLTTGTLAETPAGKPDLLVRIVSPIAAIAVRFVNAYLTTLVGLVTAAMTPLGQNILPASDFGELVMKCASLSVAGAAVGFAKDVLTIFAKLERKYPLLTGSI